MNSLAIWRYTEYLEFKTSILERIAANVQLKSEWSMLALLLETRVLNSVLADDKINSNLCKTFPSLSSINSRIKTTVGIQSCYYFCYRESQVKLPTNTIEELSSRVHASITSKRTRVKLPNCPPTLHRRTELWKLSPLKTTSQIPPEAVFRLSAFSQRWPQV